MSTDGSPLGDRAAGLRTAHVPYVHHACRVGGTTDERQARRRGARAPRWHDRGVRRRHVRRVDGARPGAGADRLGWARCCCGSRRSPSRRSRASWWCTTPACRAARSRSSSNQCFRRHGWSCSVKRRSPGPSAASRPTSDGTLPGWADSDSRRHDAGGIGADIVAAVVVASHGRGEEVALTAALRAAGALHRARRQPQAGRSGARIARRRQRWHASRAHARRARHRRPVERRGRAVDHGRDRLDQASAIGSCARRHRGVGRHRHRSGVRDVGRDGRVVTPPRPRRRARVVLRKRLPSGHSPPTRPPTP